MTHGHQTTPALDTVVRTPTLFCMATFTEEAGHWPCKCNDCGHEFHVVIRLIRERKYRVTCPGSAHVAGGLSMVVSLSLFDDQREQSLKVWFDPYAGMFRLSPPDHAVYLIGTSHGYQVEGQAPAGAFSGLIGSYLDSVPVGLIAEEMSLEGLARHGAVASVCKRLAESRGLLHRYCDPDMATRSSHGIQALEPIILQGQRSGLSDEEIARQVRELAYDPREQYWLAQLLEPDRWPILFVCGADHVDSFAEKVRALGRPVMILERDWAPPVASPSAQPNRLAP